MYGGSGGNGGCDGQCGSDTGRPGYLDATVNISDSTINIAPGGGGGTGASNVNWNTAGGTAGANTLNSSFNGGTGGRAGSNGSSGAGGGGGAASLVEVGSGSGIYLVAGGAGGGGAGRYQNGTPGENTYTANGTSYTGANGQDVGGSRDGGGAGGGGGGYYGGQQNGLYVVSGEYEGYGGHRGANGIVDSEGNFAAASTINSNTYYGSSTSNGQIGQVVLTLSTTSYSYAEHNLTINTGAGTVDLNGDVANIGTLSVTTTSSDSDISGVISTDTIVTKAGAGTLTLSGTNTYTGQTNVNAGTLAVTVNDALGTNAAGTVIASGATLDLQNVTYSTTEAITNSGTLSTSTGTSSYAGTMTLGADATIDVDGTQLTISTAIGDGGNGYAITKDGNGTLVLSANSTYSGDTIISDGTLTVTGTLADTTDVSVASGAVYDVDASDTIQSLTQVLVMLN
jgi:autotransporter-associated beta strand protein